MSLYAKEIPIHLGFWINWSYGQVGGATLTLTRRDGAFVVAFLAIFVGIAANSLWRIACFGLHLYLSSGTIPQDGLYHQRQAILRNSSNAITGLKQFFRVHLAWRKKTRKVHGRMLPMVVLAASLSIASGAAGVLSSWIFSSDANEVLISGVYCGVTDEEKFSSTIERAGFVLPYISKQAQLALNYVSQCYNDGSPTDECKVYVKSTLSPIINRDVECPFGKEICVNQSNNMRLDTGFLDSHDDLGMNLPRNFRFLYRVVEQCAPLATNGYTKTNSIGDSSYLIQTMRYYYGAPNGQNQDVHTYEYPFNSTRELFNLTSTAVNPPDYSLTSRVAYGGNRYNDSEFTPIAALVRPDADTNLIFLSANNIAFFQKSDDPWFSVHKNGTAGRWLETQEMTPTFRFDIPATVMGCTVQEQYCNPNLPGSQRCEPLRATSSIPEDTFSKLWSDPSQERMMKFLSRALNEAALPMDEILSAMGPAALKIRSSLSSGFQYNLAEHQWQIEIEHLFNTTLATIQRTLVETATGHDPTYQKFMYFPNSTEEQTVCKSQKVRSTGYQNFTVLGLSLILVIGCLIILFEQGMVTLVRFMESRFKVNLYRQLEWDSNSILELQRLAHEELGFGPWSITAGGIPVTTCEAEPLAVLDISDNKHPVLKKKQTSTDVPHNSMEKVLLS